jgi:hypothetical protein
VVTSRAIDRLRKTLVNPSRDRICAYMIEITQRAPTPTVEDRHKSPRSRNVHSHRRCGRRWLPWVAARPRSKSRLDCHRLSANTTINSYIQGRSQALVPSQLSRSRPSTSDRGFRRNSRSSKAASRSLSRPFYWHLMSPRHCAADRLRDRFLGSAAPALLSFRVPRPPPQRGRYVHRRCVSLRQTCRSRAVPRAICRARA